MTSTPYVMPTSENTGKTLAIRSITNGRASQAKDTEMEMEKIRETVAMVMARVMAIIKKTDKLPDRPAGIRQVCVFMVM